MSEPIFQLPSNGEEVQQADFDLLGQTSGLADDRVLAEFLRFPPYTDTVVKAIYPYGTSTSAAAGTVSAPGTASGSVLINPFRAIVGSRTAAATDALKSWRDVRSGVLVGGGGSWNYQDTPPDPPTSLTQTVALSANSSGNSRIDLIYAAIAPDADGAGQVRYVKDPATAVVTAPTLVTTLSTIVSIGVVVGTPASLPAQPSTPADAAGTYYIPLAYVRLATGFTASTIVLPTDILEVAPIQPFARSAGGASMTVANQQNKFNGTVMSTSNISTWANAAILGTGAGRPMTFIPPTAIGCQSLQVAMDLSTFNSANWSHQNGSVVDDSTDWRDRTFRTTIQLGPPTSVNGSFAWDYGNSSSASFIPQVVLNSASLNDTVVQVSGSYRPNGITANGLGGNVPSTGSVLAFVTPGGFPSVSPATGFGLYVDGTTGYIKAFVPSTSSNCMAFFWIDASGPYPNNR